jgi:hypothetical protein
MVASVIVDDFHLMGVVIAPEEADPPTLVDADAVLAGPVALERLQMISGRAPKILQSPGKGSASFFRTSASKARF